MAEKVYVIPKGYLPVIIRVVKDGDAKKVLYEKKLNKKDLKNFQKDEKPEEEKEDDKT